MSTPTPRLNPKDDKNERQYYNTAPPRVPRLPHFVEGRPPGVEMQPRGSYRESTFMDVLFNLPNYLPGSATWDLQSLVQERLQDPFFISERNYERRRIAERRYGNESLTIPQQRRAIFGGNESAERAYRNIEQLYDSGIRNYGPFLNVLAQGGGYNMSPEMARAMEHRSLLNPRGPPSNYIDLTQEPDEPTILEPGQTSHGPRRQRRRIEPAPEPGPRPRPSQRPKYTSKGKGRAKRR